MIKLTEQEAIERVINKCKEKNYEFLGFKNNFYENNKSKLILKCNNCGNIWDSTTYDKFMTNRGCPRCKINKLKLQTMSFQEFIGKAREVHGTNYDYSKSIYKGNKTKICIICPIHGEFWQTPNSHLLGHGCPMCAKNKKHTLEDFIEQANKIHKFRYVYTKSKYINYETKICIICPIHGEFWQTPHVHLRGKGCPICKQSKLEKKIYDLLTENKINFITQYQYNKSNLNTKLDFFIPSKNIGIECQGIQHFKPVAFGSKITPEENLKITQTRDLNKYTVCQQQNITLIYYTNQTFLNEIPQNSPIYKNNVFTDLSEIIDFIQKH